MQRYKMRKIRNTMPFLHVLLLSALLLAGCVSEKFPGAGSVAEGEPSRIELNLIIPVMSGNPATRALTPEEESKIDNIRVMVFRPDGSVVTNRKYAGSGTRVTVDSYSGSNYTLFFIANVSSAEIEAKLQSAASLPEVEGIVTTATQLDFGMNTTHPLMMIGKQENVTFAPGNSTYGTPIQLHFIAAKVTLIVIDKTPVAQGVSIIGWDVENAPARSYLFPHTADINQPGTTADKDDYWLTTDVDYPFEAEDKPNKTVSQTLYVFENRRGGRVNRQLPTGAANKYPGMSFNDQDHRGKGWFKPARATAIVIKAMHKTTFETKQVKAHIYLGADNHSDYNIERGKHYTFTVTVNGLNDIKVDSNVDYVLGELLVDHGDNLTMDAHPDFRPMRIHAPKGKVIMEILDNAGRAYNDPNFDATWLKISPLNLMFHQVKQTGAATKWQQDANPTSKIVRGRCIPHTSVRKTLTEAQKWWAVYPDIAATVQDDDDNEMTFAKATYRMCYKITDIPFDNSAAVTNHTLYVYADEYLQQQGNIRRAQVRFTFLKDGSTQNPEVRIFNISQDGYIPIFDETNPDAGLALFNIDGTHSNIKKQFVFENKKELKLTLNPGIDPSLQRTFFTQWGFSGIYLHSQRDSRRNGKFLTANAVYTDVQRNANHEPAGFGKAQNSYRPMYGNNRFGGDKDAIPAYSGTNTGAPYYYPDANGRIYHPIYKSSAARYCHEKNRDVNGDGIIDESEAKWYMPANDQLLMAWIAGIQDNLERTMLISSSESQAELYFYVSFDDGYLRTRHKDNIASVFCIRDL